MATETRAFGNTIADLLEDAGMKRVADVARFYGMSHPGAQKIVAEDADPSVSRANDYLAPLGYELAIVPMGAELPNGCTRIVGAKHKNRSKGGTVNE